MPLNDNITLYVTIPYFSPTCFGLHQDLLITDLNRSFSRVHIIFSIIQLLSLMFRTETYQNRNVFICRHVTIIILVYIFFEILSKTNIFCLPLCTIYLHSLPTHPHKVFCSILENMPVTRIRLSTTDYLTVRLRSTLDTRQQRCGA
jgi:hypothetical protein